MSVYEQEIELYAEMASQYIYKAKGVTLDEIILEFQPMDKVGELAVKHSKDDYDVLNDLCERINEKLDALGHVVR
jgi:hypothetical protein